MNLLTQLILCYTLTSASSWNLSNGWIPSFSKRRNGRRNGVQIKTVFSSSSSNGSNSGNGNGNRRSNGSLRVLRRRPFRVIRKVRRRAGRATRATTLAASTTRTTTQQYYKFQEEEDDEELILDEEMAMNAMEEMDVINQQPLLIDVPDIQIVKEPFLSSPSTSSSSSSSSSTSSTTTTNDPTLDTNEGIMNINPTTSIPLPQIKKKGVIIRNVAELRSAILDQGLELKDISFHVRNFKSVTKAKNLYNDGTTSSSKRNGRKRVVKAKGLSQSKWGIDTTAGLRAGASTATMTPPSPTTAEATIGATTTITSRMESNDNTPATTTRTTSSSTLSESTESTTATEQQQKETPTQLFSHEVLSLLQQRAATNSKPGHRSPDDKAHLALSIEGGGMRGAVSAGMVAAIASLGLCDSFDSVYGSSAGSVIGAYMISRQVSVDVYTDLLPSAKTKFVSKTKLVSWIARNLLDTTVLKKKTRMTRNLVPAMNISFVLDEIMCPTSGLRPLDLDAFHANDQFQPLRIVTSSVRQGKMETTCFGSKEMDFVHDGNDDGTVDGTDNTTLYVAATANIDGTRQGLFACLETSMTVPAAAGQPKDLLRLQDVTTNITTTCFDAFCYEPIPYRSAVEEGATHVVVLKTRPDQSPIGTDPGVFEKIVAPMYFDSHNMSQVSRFFKKGGQQYIYVEDYLTLEEAKVNTHAKGTLVPPSKILYGVESNEEIQELIDSREEEWKRAHLLPIAVPDGEPELSTLSLDKEDVLRAVRQGFAAAFDMLAPTVGIELNDTNMNGKRVAELIFPSLESSKYALKQPVPTAGNFIHDDDDDVTEEVVEDSDVESDNEEVVTSTIPIDNDIMSQVGATPVYNLRQQTPFERDWGTSAATSKKSVKPKHLEPCKVLDAHMDAHMLLDTLPGLKSGKMPCLERGLHNHIMHSPDFNGDAAASRIEEGKGPSYI